MTCCAHCLLIYYRFRTTKTQLLELKEAHDQDARKAADEALKAANALADVKRSADIAIKAADEDILAAKAAAAEASGIAEKALVDARTSAAAELAAAKADALKNLSDSTKEWEAAVAKDAKALADAKVCLRQHAFFMLCWRGADTVLFIAQRAAAEELTAVKEGATKAAKIAEKKLSDALAATAAELAAAKAAASESLSASEDAKKRAAEKDAKALAEAKVPRCFVRYCWCLLFRLDFAASFL